MNRVSLETDIRYALRTYFGTRIAYPVMAGVQNDVGITNITGDLDGVPYGDLYQKGDVFTQPVGDGLLGQVYYVANSTPGDPTITVLPEATVKTQRPKVVIVDGIWRPEIKEGGSRVHVGIRSKPTARAARLRALFAGRVLHDDREHVIITSPIWRGTVWLHVDGVERRETSYVTEMVNSRFQVTSDIYKLAVNVVPRRLELSNLENSGLFRNVINFDVDAGLTPASPLDQLPDGLPDTIYFPWTEIVGVSPVVEPHNDDPLPRYAEKVGDYPLSETADDSGLTFDMPPTE